MYARTVNGQLLTFEVAGFWRRNMMMRDRETGSIWQQATGEVVAGPLQGAQLGLLGAEQTTWSAWSSQHPETVVAVEPLTAKQGYIYLFPYQALFDRFARIGLTFPGCSLHDPRLPSREEVAGISLAGVARAYPISILRRLHIVNDQVGGIPIVVFYEGRGDYVRAFQRKINGIGITLIVDNNFLSNTERTLRWNLRGEPVTGTEKRLEPIIVARQWWLAWSEFHPGSSIFQVAEQHP